MSKIETPLFESSAESSTKRIIKEDTTISTDYTTGEIKNTTTTENAFFDKEPSYIKLYIADISHLNNITKHGSIVLYELLKLMDYKNIIKVVMYDKKEIAEKLGTTVQVINNNITQLVKKHILIREGTARYLINPILFGKGSWKENREMRKNLKMSITYNAETNEKTFSANEEE
jgi:hypothetical protein